MSPTTCFVQYVRLSEHSSPLLSSLGQTVKQNAENLNFRTGGLRVEIRLLCSSNQGGKVTLGHTVCMILFEAVSSIEITLVKIKCESDVK